MAKKIMFFFIIVWVIWATIYYIKKPMVTTVNWGQLSNIPFKKIWYAPYNTNVEMPLFNDTIKKLDSTLISIRGYVIPMEYGSKKFALSKNPNASCFFCNAAGVQTIIIINCKNKPINYPTDAFIKMTGKLSLKETFNDFIYTLNDAY